MAQRIDGFGVQCSTWRADNPPDQSPPATSDLLPQAWKRTPDAWVNGYQRNFRSARHRATVCEWSRKPRCCARNASRASRDANARSTAVFVSRNLMSACAGTDSTTANIAGEPATTSRSA